MLAWQKILVYWILFASVHLYQVLYGYNECNTIYGVFSITVSRTITFQIPTSFFPGTISSIEEKKDLEILLPPMHDICIVGTGP